MSIQAPTFENRITIGSIAALVGLLVTTIGFGISIGSLRTDVDVLQQREVQRELDSRALIRLSTDMDYLKDAVDEIRDAQKGR